MLPSVPREKCWPSGKRASQACASRAAVRERSAALMTPALLAEAPEAVQAEWLPAIASGEALVVPALHERASRHRWQRVGVRAAPVAVRSIGVTRIS